MAEYAEKTDEELFELVKRQNDEKAFRVLYRRYDKRLYAYCHRVAGDKVGAQDIFQTVITAVFEKKEQFIGGNFVAWLFTIARNASLKHTEFTKRSQAYSNVDDYSEILPDNSDTTGEDILLRETVHKAMSKLQQDFREALELRYYEEFSYEEISEILNISVSLAKVRVFRAKQQLQQILSPILRELYQ